ncbi:MAG: TrpR-like protein YerC/YecD [Clostridiales bacterium]|nr:TrpR-like protein YerC/YecD [Clostridiales bacterium]
MFTPKVQNEQTDLLMKALLSLTSMEEAYRFCEDVLTVQELKSITQRLEVAILLKHRVTYQEIAKTTGASTATISRVNRSLLYGADGYTFVLRQIDPENDARSPAGISAE